MNIDTATTTTTTTSAASTSTLLRRAHHDDLAGAAVALGAAFQADPVFMHCVPDATRRRLLLPRFFRLVADTVFVHDEMFVASATTRPVSGAIDGVAVWLPAGVAAVAEQDGERFGADLADIFGHDVPQVFEVQAMLDEHTPAAPHRHLWFLGVVPSRQGQGIGNDLLEPVLAAADERGEASYLEATSKDNRRLYERHGFEVVDELHLDAGPAMWTMWREPRPT